MAIDPPVWYLQTATAVIRWGKDEAAAKHAGDWKIFSVLLRLENGLGKTLGKPLRLNDYPMFTQSVLC